MIVCLFTLCLGVYGQSKCDSLSEDIYFATEIGPKMNIGFEELESRVNNDIDIKDFGIKKEQELHVSLIINCRGEGFDYKVFKSNNNALNNKLVQSLKNNIKWDPAKHNGENVDFSYVFAIRISSDYINILDDKEKRKKNTLIH